jgi:hemoglobin-like flavoprotein
VVVEPLKKLGLYHKKKNVELVHYDVVGQALMNTLKIALGDKLTPELKELWGAIYTIVMGVMTEGLYNEE